MSHAIYLSEEYRGSKSSGKAPLVTIELYTVERAGRARTLRPQGERERVLIWVFLLSAKLLATIRPDGNRVKENYLRELPRDIVLGAQAFSAFLQACEVSGGHHASTVTRRSRNREGARDLLLNTRNKVLILVAIE